MTHAHRNGPVSRMLGIPLHEQIRVRLAAQIADGTLPPAHRLPSEADLAKTFGVSLSPLRAALRELADAGLIRRERGSGTFVRGPMVAITVDLLDSFSQTMQAAHVQYAVDLVDASEVVADASVGPHWDDSVVDRCVRIERVAAIDGARSVLLESWLPLPHFADLLDTAVMKSAGNSLHTALGKHYRIKPWYDDRAFAVSAADDGLVAKLDVPFGSPVLTIETVGRGADGRVVEWASVTYDATRFSFRLSTPHGVERRKRPARHHAPAAARSGARAASEG